MSAKKVGGRIVTGCLATMLLLSAGVVLAQSRINLGFDQFPVERDQKSELRSAAARDRRLPILANGFFRSGDVGGALTFGNLLGVSPARVEATSGTAPVALASTHATAPWFLKILVLFRTDGICRLEPTDRAPTAERPAKAQLAPRRVALPGSVKNLRRADQ